MLNQVILIGHLGADPEIRSTQDGRKIANFSLASVWRVASTPTTPERVRCAAGLMAGSMPTMGTAKRRRNASSAALDAVLHATTTAFACRVSRNSLIATERASMNAAVLSP